MEKRKLGYMEAVCAATAQRWPNTTTIVAIAEIQGHLDEEILVDAIELMFERHPMLHSVMLEEQGNIYLQDTAKFDDILIEFCDMAKQSVDRIVSREMKEPFTPSKALWRMTILIDHTHKKNKVHKVILSIHHSISDAASTCLFMHDLFEIYEKLEEDIDYEEEALPFLDCVEELINSNKTLDEYVKEKKKLLEFTYDHFPYESETEYDKRETKTIYDDFSSQEVEAIHRTARENKVTVNALLSAAMLLSYAELFNRPIKTPMYTHVNMRKFCIPEIGKEHFGLFSGAIRINFSIDPKKDSLIDVAERYRNQFEIEIDYQIFKPNKLPMKTQDLFQSIEKRWDESSHSFHRGIYMTNLGQYTHPTCLKRHMIQKMHFTTCQLSADFPLVTQVITTDLGMFTTTSWTHPHMSDQKAKRFCDLFRHHLATHCNFAKKNDQLAKQAS
ncbi:MAG: hypothetical protein K9M07_04740 [Simkaniaceae bacterium]|nr:hypothetical protein [Simkaniaceae bacterium]